MVAAGVTQACVERGWNVPVDVKGISVDGVSLAELVHPKLSTLGDNQSEIGKKANSLTTQAISLKP